MVEQSDQRMERSGLERSGHGTKWPLFNLEGKGSRQNDLDAVLPMIFDSSLTVVSS